MNKFLFLFISVGLFFVSCGGSDITPPTSNGNTNFNIKHLIGEKEGRVTISLLPGEAGKTLSIKENSKAMASSIIDNKNTLQLLFMSPAISEDLTLTMVYKKTTSEESDDKKHLFSFGKFSPSKITLEEHEVPSFLKTWFPINSLVKVEIINMTETQTPPNYNIDTDILTLSYEADLVLYDRNGKDPITGYSILYEYILLK